MNIHMWPDWEIVRKIGAGSYGEVYEIQRGSGSYLEKAALKVIRVPSGPAELEQLRADGIREEDMEACLSRQVEEIRNEIGIMQRFVGFSNIVSYEDYLIRKHPQETGWDILIRMELLTSLPEYMSSCPLTEADALRLGMDISQALIICHEAGIIHRDIKPQNIFLNDHGFYKLGDFGISGKPANGGSVPSIKGAVSYMAPETFDMQGADARSDIYSLALVIYRILNGGREPFLTSPGFTPAQKEEAQRRRLSGERLPRPAGISDRFWAVLSKALQGEPGARYQTAAQFYEALRRCVSGEAAADAEKTVTILKTAASQPVPSGSRQNQTGPSGSRQNQTGPSGSRQNQTGPSGSRQNQTGPSGSRQNQTGPSGSRQDRTGSSGSLQTRTGFSGPSSSGRTEEGNNFRHQRADSIQEPLRTNRGNREDTEAGRSTNKKTKYLIFALIAAEIVLALLAGGILLSQKRNRESQAQSPASTSEASSGGAQREKESVSTADSGNGKNGNGASGADSAGNENGSSGPGSGENVSSEEKGNETGGTGSAENGNGTAGADSAGNESGTAGGDSAGNESGTAGGDSAGNESGTAGADSAGNENGTAGGDSAGNENGTAGTGSGWEKEQDPSKPGSDDPEEEESEKEEPETDVAFADPALEKAVREYLKTGSRPITAAEAREVTTLELKGSGKSNRDKITDLTGLEAFSNLKELDLLDNRVEDLSPLTSLVHLKTLKLESNQVSSLSPLTGMTGLVRLDLYDNMVSDLSPLSRLSNLEVLDFRNNFVDDLTALEGLTALRELAMSDNRFDDIYPVRKLHMLWYLSFNNTEVSDLSPIADLVNLTTLCMSDTLVEDVSVLRRLPVLGYLKIQNCDIEDRTPIEELKKRGNVKVVE